MKAVLDHIGIAVRDLSAALAFYRDALGLEVEAPEEVATQRVRAHFIPVGESALELLEATADDSPIARYIEKRGPGIHHVTLRVDDIDAALAQLKARHIRLIDESPRPGAENARVAFIHPASAHGVLVELKQRATKAVAVPAHASPEATVARFQLGEFELISLHDGFFRVDGGGIFGIVPKTRWAALARPDERNRVTLAMRPLVVRGRRTMLIDAGLGDKTEPSFNDTFGVNRATNLDHTLASAGLTANDIDIVLATHLHFDHAGGFTVRDAEGRLRPRFPRARYVVRRGEWEDAVHPHARSRGGYLADDFMPLKEAGVLELVDDDQTIMPGVRVQHTGGHTQHHQVAWIESNGQHAVYAGDIMPTTMHLTDAWIAALDLFPMQTMAAKQRLVKDIIERRARVFFEHDPAVAVGQIEEHGGKRRVVPV